MVKEKLVSPSEATSLLGISYSTLIRHIRKGVIPCIRVGKQIRIPESYFDDLLRSFEKDGKEISNEC